MEILPVGRANGCKLAANRLKKQIKTRYNPALVVSGRDGVDSFPGFFAGQPWQKMS
jgi:hypothetical protein